MILMSYKVKKQILRKPYITPKGNLDAYIPRLIRARLNAGPALFSRRNSEKYNW